MAIYDAGTASLAADGTVTGVGTTWRQPLTLIRVGATMIFNTTPASIVTIAEIISDTEIRVFNDKGFTAPAGTQYSILAHDGITVQGLAQDVAETLRYYQSSETEVAAAVDAFNQFDADSFQQNVTNVNNQSLQVATDASQVANDRLQVSSDKDSAAASAANAQQSAQDAASSASSVSGALIGSFQDGVTIQSRSQQVIDIGTGKAMSYLWAGALPKTVPQGSTPLSTGGISDSAWVPIGISGIESLNYTKPYSGAVSLPLSSYINHEINVDDFGAKGDAFLPDGSPNPDRTDDTDAFQAAINQAYRLGGVKVVASPNKNYFIARKVFVLASESGSDIETTSYPRRRLQIIDLQGATIVGRDDTANDGNVFIETGYIDSNGVVQSAIGKGEEEYLTIGTMIMNATLVNFYQGLRLYNHVFGCKVSDIVCVNVQQPVYTERCFYTAINNVQANGTHTIGLPRYHLKDNVNIQPLTSVVTGVCDVGLFIEGASEALTFRDCGIESFTSYGVRIVGGYNVKFDSCYFESNNPNVYGCYAQSTKSITLENSWVFGSSLKMFGGLNDNCNVSVSENNVISGGAVLWVDSEGSNYNLSTIREQSSISEGGNTLSEFPGKDSVRVDKNVVFYNPNVGLDDIIGVAEQTTRYHKQKVNGQYSKGSTASHTVGATTTTESDGGGIRVVWKTQIRYSDTQLIYAALKVDSSIGTWFWNGMICNASPHGIVQSDATQVPSTSNENGFVVIRSPVLPSGGVGIYGGEIRLV